MRPISLAVVQNQREVTLAGFRSGKFPVLVATDVAARGLDISGVELVVQCEPPKDPETYIHRSGKMRLHLPAWALTAYCIFNWLLASMCAHSSVQWLLACMCTHSFVQWLLASMCHSLTHTDLLHRSYSGQLHSLPAWFRSLTRRFYHQADSR
jgi:hypothetical protein